MATPNYNDPRAGTNAFSIGQQELLRLKNRIGFIEEAFEKLDDDPTDAIPTKLSQLQNDVGFITEDDIPAGTGGTVPTKTSDLTNDSGFITEDDLPTVPTKTSDLTNDSGFVTHSGRIASLETWKKDQTSTYGADYTIRAVWNGDSLYLKCINPSYDSKDYGISTEYAQHVAWSGITGKPTILTEEQVRAIVSEMMG